MYTNEGGTSSLERPSLQRLRKIIRNREVDVVLVAHFHFLASNPEHLALLYQEMLAHGVELLSAHEGPGQRPRAVGLLLHAWTTMPTRWS